MKFTVLISFVQLNPLLLGFMVKLLHSLPPNLSNVSVLKFSLSTLSDLRVIYHSAPDPVLKPKLKSV